MGIISRYKKKKLEKEQGSLWKTPFDEEYAEMQKSWDALMGERIMVLTKRPSEDSFSTIIEVEGFKTKPDEVVMLSREKQAEMWGYVKCPKCGEFYGASDVDTCICGAKFREK